MPRLFPLSGNRMSMVGRIMSSAGITSAPNADKTLKPKVGRDALYQKEDVQASLGGAPSTSTAAQINTMDGQMAREQARRKRIVGNRAEAAVQGRGAKRVRGGTLMAPVDDELAKVRLPKYMGPAVAKVPHRNNIKLSF